MTLAQRIAELIEKHGSLRAAARVLEVEPGYLSRLAAGKKVNPGRTILRRMGLRRVVTYECIDTTTPRCTCLTGQLGPDYCEVHAA